MKIKAVIFDADGMIVHGERFSSRLAKEYGILTDVTGTFFKNEFQNCLMGKADLKEELQKYLPQWNWKGSLDELLEFWFSEKYNFIEERIEKEIQVLRKRGIKCYLATNNEKYRTENLVNDRGMGKWFDGIFSSAYIGSKKPEAEFFIHILKNIGNVPKEEVVFWDDDVENLDGAKAVGLNTELYTEDWYKYILLCKLASTLIAIC